MPNTEDLPEKRLESFRANWDFFARLKFRRLVGWCFNTNSFYKPRDLVVRGSILFVEQPNMHLPLKWSLTRLMRRSLICYVPYGLKVAAVENDHFSLPLHDYAWRVFAETAWHQQQFVIRGKRRGSNVRVTGHPRLDALTASRKAASNVEFENRNPRVIWAPHWSVRDNYLSFSTFEKFHTFFAELALNDGSIDWVFRPHQRLSAQLLSSQFYSRKEIDAYYKFWTTGKNRLLSTDGDYMDLFVNSDALITDCGSFLAEYLPTENPILVLRNPDSVGYNAFGSMLVNSYYKASSVEEIRDFVREVVKKRRDPGLSQRKQLLAKIAPPGNKQTASQAIMEELLANVF